MASAAVAPSPVAVTQMFTSVKRFPCITTQPQPQQTTPAGLSSRVHPVKLTGQKAVTPTTTTETQKLAEKYMPREGALTPSSAIARYGRVLSKYEKDEIFSYAQVYFVGPTAAKIRADPSKKENNYGYDNEKSRYNVIKNDHIGYRFEVLQGLGKGSFGDVVKVYDHKKKCHVALKIIRNEKRFHDQAQEEVKLLEALKKKDRNDKHNIIHMKESFLFRGHLCITFEMLAGDLYGELKKGNFAGFSMERVRNSAVDLVQCLRNLRRSRIIHCDLKPENILQRSPGSSNVKVIDFGSSCYTNERIHTYIQSRFYRSPEITLGMSYGMPIDMWSLGCILTELYTGRPLFPALSETELLLMHIEYLGHPPRELLRSGSRSGKYFDSSYRFKRVVDQKGNVRHIRPKTLTKLLSGAKNKHFIDFVSKCLQWDPEQRMTPREASRHPFLTGMASTSSKSTMTSAATSLAKTKYTGGATISMSSSMDKPHCTKSPNSFPRNLLRRKSDITTGVSHTLKHDDPTVGSSTGGISKTFTTPTSHLKSRALSDSCVLLKETANGVTLDRSTKQQSQIFNTARSLDHLHSVQEHNQIPPLGNIEQLVPQKTMGSSTNSTSVQHQERTPPRNATTTAGRIASLYTIKDTTTETTSTTDTSSATARRPLRIVFDRYA